MGDGGKSWFCNVLGWGEEGGPYSAGCPFCKKYKTFLLLLSEYIGVFIFFSFKIAKDGTYEIRESKWICKIMKNNFTRIWSVLATYCFDDAWQKTLTIIVNYSQNARCELLFRTLMKLRLKTRRLQAMFAVENL